MVALSLGVSEAASAVMVERLDEEEFVVEVTGGEARGSFGEDMVVTFGDLCWSRRVSME